MLKIQSMMKEKPFIIQTTFNFIALVEKIHLIVRVTFMEDHIP